MARFVLELIRRIKYFAARHRLQAELREEMDTHFAMLAEDTNPMSARSRLGNRTRWEEISRGVWISDWLESVVRDARYGVRLLLRSPIFTATACLSLAIGLGATTGIFSLMNALLFKTLPVPEPGQLWELGHNAEEDRDDNFSYPMFRALQTANATNMPLFAVGGDYLQVNYGTAERRTPALIVSGEALSTLGLKPYIGRLLTPEDDNRSLPRGANCVLSYRLWQSQFHGDPAALGRRITIGAQQLTIVGVAPPSFFGFYVGAYSDLILPIAAYAATNPAQPILDSSSWTWLNILTRAPSDLLLRQLMANLNAAYLRIRKRISPPSEVSKPDRLYDMTAAHGLSAIRESFAKPLYVLLTATAFTLLIACANLANLLLARSFARDREMAIRLSIGAHRMRILRQSLTESALIAALGGCAGIPVYFACTTGLVTFLQSGLDHNVFLDTRPDWRFATGIVALLFSAVFFFGFIPALRSTQPDLNAALSENAQRLTGRTSFGRLIVAVQISLSAVLLLGATLLSQSLLNLRAFNPGFRRDHLLLADIDTSQTIRKNAEVAQFFGDLVAQVRAMPGVRSAAASAVVPLAGSSWQQDYERIDQTEKAAAVYHSFENWVTPDYFETLGTPLILGRNFDAHDSSRAVHVALVNQTFAARFFGTSNPIGHKLRAKGKTDPITIVGIVGDSRYLNLNTDAPPTLYRPIAQLPPSFPFVLTLNLEVWTRTPAEAFKKQISNLVTNDDSQATINFHTFDALIDSNLIYQRLLTALSMAFGVIGVLLSAMGVYGLSAYSVARRIPEFGIRMALGASPQGILSLVLLDQIRLLGVALAAGLLIAMALTRFLRAWLFGVSATDPVLYSIALFVISVFAVLAAFVPACRAARLNPLSALRCD